MQSTGSKKSIFVFIDGNQGTTGLELGSVIEEYNEKNSDFRFKIIILPDKDRKSIPHRLQAMEQSDITVLCLPDEASREIVAAADIRLKGKDLKIIDTSTAFRTAKEWVYGFADMAGQREKIRNSFRVSNPGCYALAFVSSIRPISENKENMWNDNCFLSTFGVSGYSGGGQKLINLTQEDEAKEVLKKDEKAKKKLDYYAPYSLDLKHKHLQEMKKYGLLQKTPLFQPAVVPTYRGMIVSTAIHAEQLTILPTNLTAEIFDLLKKYYSKSERVCVKTTMDGYPEDNERLFEDKFLRFSENDNTENIDIIVAGNAKKCIIHARLDNLGIGAARNAFYNLRLMVGC